MTTLIWKKLVGALPPHLTVEQVQGIFRRSGTLVRKRLSQCGYRWAGERVQRLPEWVGQADWSLTNADLAKQYGKSRERVRQYRQILGKKKVVPPVGRKPNPEKAVAA